MALSRRKFSAEFKLRAARQVEAGASTAAVARRYEIHPTLLTKWCKQLRQDPERPPAPETVVLPSWPPGSATLRRPSSLAEKPSMH
ncbi:MAG: transposase [Bryobacterales bacterium]|nr:transposase [Bryobacterales bacterium]